MFVFFYDDYVDNNTINNDNNDSDEVINSVIINKLEVIFDEACYRRYASHMHKENSWIYRVKVNVLRLQIKVVKQVCKSVSNGVTNAHVVGDCLVLTTIRVITHGP